MTIFPYYKKTINGIYTIFKHTHMLFFFGKRVSVAPCGNVTQYLDIFGLHYLVTIIYTIHNLFERGLHNVKIFRARRSFARRLQTVIVDAAAT